MRSHSNSLSSSQKYKKTEQLKTDKIFLAVYS